MLGFWGTGDRPRSPAPPPPAPKIDRSGTQSCPRLTRFDSPERQRIVWHRSKCPQFAPVSPLTLNELDLIARGDCPLRHRLALSKPGHSPTLTINGREAVVAASSKRSA